MKKFLKILAFIAINGIILGQFGVSPLADFTIGAIAGWVLHYILKD
jgi:hypothetical protein